MWRILALCILTTGLAAAKVTYKNYKLFSILPMTQKQMDVLYSLKNDTAYDYWKEPSRITIEADIMVPPHKLNEFNELMIKHNFPYQVKIKNIQRLIDDTTPRSSSKSFDFNNYHRMNEINSRMFELSLKHDNVKQLMICCAYQEYMLGGIQIINGDEKPTVFIEGGMHGREWISPATVMYILQALLTSNDTRVRHVADNHNWYIFPVINPEGYEYTFTDDRLWSKTVKPSSPICNGSDLNRNWNSSWNNHGTSQDSCAQNYPGSEPFSEPEAKSISDFMSKHHFYTYISFQSYGQKLMIPYAYTHEHTVPNYNWLFRIAKNATNALEKKYGTRYKVGTVSEWIGLTGGTSIDYVTRVLHKPFAFIYKLRDASDFGYLLPPTEIIPTGEETLSSLVILLTETLKSEYAKEN